MPVTLVGDLKIKQNLVYGGYVERITQKIVDFNRDTNGAIVLGSDIIESGFFQEEAFVNLITNFTTTGFGSRRDPETDTAVDDKKFTEGTVNEFRLSRRAGPISWAPSAFDIKGISDDVVSIRLGYWLADYSYYNMLVVAIKSAITAIAKIGTDVYNNDFSVALTTKNLANITELRKNNFQNGVLWVMDSTSYYKLFKDQLNTQSAGFGSQEVATGIVRGGTAQSFGIPQLVLELDDLHTITSNARSHDKVFLLNRGSVALNQGAIRTHESVVDGRDNLKKRWQAEYDISCQVKGFSFNNTTKNPTDAQLTTAANWTYQYSEPHDGPGYGGVYDAS